MRGILSVSMIVCKPMSHREELCTLGTPSESLEDIQKDSLAGKLLNKLPFTFWKV